MTCGATYTPNSDDLTASVEDDQSNLNAINQLIDHLTWSTDEISLGHRVSIRTATPDYAPVIGQLADTDVEQRTPRPATQCELSSQQ